MSARAEHGVSIPEVLVAILLLALVSVPFANAITSSKRATLVAQRSEAMIHQAQKEIDSLRAVDYDSLKLSTAPAYSSDPLNPDNRILIYYVPFLRVSTAPDRYELIVWAADGAVDRGPSTVTVGNIRLRVYRYVSRVDQSCTPDASGRNPCGTGTGFAKRVTVAVVADNSTSANLKPAAPYWLSTVVRAP
jgi:Tfp pilus assembly protein PilV